MLRQLTRPVSHRPQKMAEVQARGGCGHRRCLARPGAAARNAATRGATAGGPAIFVILLAWNDFFYALVLTSGNACTVTPHIGGFITDKAVLWGRLYASSAIMVSVLIFGLAVQKQLAHGLTGGAVKG
jgi:hypothetical protein